MKKVEVCSVKVDSATDLYNNLLEQNIIDSWTSSEEYKFIEKNSVSIEQVDIPNHDRFERTILFYAIMDEKIETFWRLKFK